MSGVSSRPGSIPRGLEIHVPAASARAFEAGAGQYVTVIDLEGQQIGDFVALNAADHTERLSTCHTRSMIRRIYIRLGDALYSNLRRPMLDVVEDDVGCHDILIAPCDPVLYEKSFGIVGHPNCLDNLSDALGRHGIERWQVPEPLNVFQNSRVDVEGNFVPRTALSRAGDRLVMRAAFDVVCAVSACAHDQLPVNGSRLTPLLVVISSEKP
jgi:uncharacterized protein